jgi:cobalt-precorrin-5B (C1)-methyltransferase
VTAPVRLGISADVENKPELRFGWTTGSCATAAAKAAFVALQTGSFPDPVEITLPRGQRVGFALAETRLDVQRAMAGVVKDAGDDPDVTHGALIRATVWRGEPGSGVVFRAGPGVGTVTRAGLPIPPGEPAINPVPRQMIRDALSEVAVTPDVVVEISIEDGERIAEQTLNGRLGIVGGLSILGTTGIVVPFSCSAWIHSIHRGIDVARAGGLEMVAGATGHSSELAVQRHHGLDDMALIDMGDFVGGMLKYLRAHPVPRVVVAGGIGKITKLAQGRIDLHSRRGSVDFAALAALAVELGATPAIRAGIEGANTTLEAIDLAEGLDLGNAIAARAWHTAAGVLDTPESMLEVLVFDSTGALLGHAGFAPAHVRNLRR